MDLLARIDAEIQKLDGQKQALIELRRMATDPQKAELIRSLFAGNKSGSTPAQTPSQIEIPTPTPRPTLRSETGFDGLAAPSHEVQRQRGMLTKFVHQVLVTANGGTMTTDGIVDVMQKAGWHFKAATPQIAVNEALNTLKDKGLAHVTAKQGLRKLWAAGSGS